MTPTPSAENDPLVRRAESADGVAQLLRGREAPPAGLAAEGAEQPAHARVVSGRVDCLHHRRELQRGAR